MSIATMLSLQVDKTFGALLVGTYANSMLYTLELVAVVQYHLATKRNQDSLLLRAIVYFSVFMDTVCTISSCMTVYSYSITHSGNLDYAAENKYWPGYVSLVGTGVATLIVQWFLIHRYWRMSQNLYITLTLALFMLGALGGFVWSMASFLSHTTMAERGKIASSITVWGGISAGTDILIALVLLWQLSKINTPFKTTQSLVHRLMASTICSGTVTSVLVIASLILFLADQQSNVAFGLAYCIGRVYTLTMLYNLNNRTLLQHAPDHTNSDLSGEKHSTINKKNGIYVHRTVDVFHGSSHNSWYPGSQR